MQPALRLWFKTKTMVEDLINAEIKRLLSFGCNFGLGPNSGLKLPFASATHSLGRWQAFSYRPNKTRKIY